MALHDLQGRALVKTALAAAGILAVAGALVLTRTNLLSPAPEKSFSLPSPSPTVSVDEVRRKFWRSHGVVDTPPTDIFEVTGRTRVTSSNQATATVSPGDATIWFSAFRRAFAAKLWSISHFRHD